MMCDIREKLPMQHKQNEPWQINNNATLKILESKQYQYCESEKIQKLRTEKMQIFNLETVSQKKIWLGQLLTWEFDPGSGWTLAACLTHASRTDKNET